VIVAQNDDELLIATNYHVIADATELSVGFSVEAENEDDLIVPAKIKGSDSKNELAVVAVQLSDISEEVRSQLKIATLGSSDSLKVGEAAIAIGNALGYGQSVTSGIISALHKEITIDNFTGELIQTDAAINFGNSGGALLNANGEVIGISVAKEVGTGSENMGYAIPIDTAIPILEQLVNRETRDKIADDAHGYMGITVVTITDDAKQLYDMPAGAFVYDVTEGSAADEAGIKKGDVITKFDGVDITSTDELVSQLDYYAVGETVTVEVQTANGGEYVSREVEVTLQAGTVSASSSASENQQDDNRSDDSNDGLYEEIPDDGEIQMLPFVGGDEDGSF
jgi:serine protease Do